MSTQFLLDEDEIKELTKLMLLMIETQESRKQLCRDLGINPQQVAFIIGTTDDTFCTELIDCLNRYGYQEYLCKLCCQKLFPILNKSVYSHRISILKKIVEKLNCNCNHYKQTHSIPTVPNPDESKPESLLIKVGNVNKKLLASGAIILIGFAGFFIGQSHDNSIIPSGSYSITCIKIRQIGRDLVADCAPVTGALITTILPNFISCKPNSIENINGQLKCDRQ